MKAGARMAAKRPANPEPLPRLGAHVVPDDGTRRRLLLVANERERLRPISTLSPPTNSKHHR
jgi:hypothetical protein